MSVSALSAKELVMLGCNLTITKDANFSALSVKEIITLSKNKGSHITIHAEGYSALTLKEFTMLAQGRLTIVV